jgi:hypothetical protein
MTAAGYVFNAPSAGGENLSITTTTEVNLLNAAGVALHHLNLFIDGDVAGRGHRKGILNNSFREVGIAMRADSNSDSFFGPPFISDVVSAQEFAASAGRIFVTGVIYFDSNLNSFYDPGETAGILDLVVKNPGGTTVASGTSFASGGYSINMAGNAAGNYTLFATDSEGDIDSVDFVWGGTINVKADLIDPAFIAPPVLGVPFRPDASIGKSLTKLTGNDFYGDSASKQSFKQKALTKKPLLWSVRFENDGSEDDNVSISGPLGSRLFRVTVQQKDGKRSKNVTAGMKVGLVEDLQTGQQTDFIIKVKPGKKALGSRTGFSFQVRGVSANASSKVDRVNGKLINRTKAPGL